MFLQIDTIPVPPAYIKNIGQADKVIRNFGWVRQHTLDGRQKQPEVTLDCDDRSGIGIIPQKASPQIQYLNYISQVLSPWSTAEPSPINRSEAGNAVVNGKLYVFGGYINSSFQATTRSDVYDPATNTWTQIADLPLPITHAGVAVDGDTIYIAGGYVGAPPSPSTAKVFKYNVTTNTWSQRPSLPAPRSAGGLVVLGRELHFISGINYDRKVDKGNHWVFNLDGGKCWISKAPLPNPRNHFGYTVNDGKIYVIGGQHLLDERRANQSDVHAYDSLTNTWTKLASLPLPRSHTHTSTFARNGRIVIVGGRANGYPTPTTLADVTEYDPLLNKWVQLSSLPEPRQAIAAKAINNQIVATTGSASGPNPQTTTWLTSE